MEKKNKGILVAAFLAVTLGVGAVATYFGHVGRSDRQNAEKYLHGMGYKIVSYEGAPKFRGRSGKEIYADEFKVVPPTSSDTVDVIVAGGPVSGQTIKWMPSR